MMSNKSLINSFQSSVDEALYGFSKLHNNLYYYPLQRVIFDKNSCGKKKISIVSGGGSGHEPFPAGYVGRGMLTASISGSIFTSPSSKQILHAIRECAENSEAVFLIIPNYTGDVLNFGLAIENAQSEGISVDSIVVGEDIAKYIYEMPTKAGKRGMCGIILVFKIAGYLSEMGEDLKQIKEITTKALESIATLGLSLSSCSKLGTGTLWEVDEDEMYLGVGVHGEAGVARLKLLKAHEAVKVLLDFLLKNLKITEGDDVVALVNNLGSLSCVEQWLLAGEVEKQLTEKKINVKRLYTGCFFTSLNMPGVQICIFKLEQIYHEVFLKALDYPSEAPAWSSKNKSPSTFSNIIEKETKTILNVSQTHSKLTPEEGLKLKKCLLNIVKELLKAESFLNYLDSGCGDGDCGSTFSRFCRKILSLIQTEEKMDFTNPIELFFQLSHLIELEAGGTTGALYGLFCKNIGKALEKYEDFGKVNVLAACWRAGINGIKKYSTARIGDKTMLDSLETGCNVFENNIKQLCSGLDAFEKAVKAAEEACQNTKLMVATAGRASCTDKALHENFDAGAYAVTVWLTAILNTLRQMQT